MKEREAVQIKEKAYTKINISLDVTGRRQDGYHDMVMIMQTVSLCDELTLTIGGGEGVRARSNMRFIPGDERNLAVKAAMKYLEAVGEGDKGVSIDIRKNIPVGAGMGGGSADAAAVLRAMNRAYEGRLSEEELVALASATGSDVAFCLVGGTMLATGRGEKLSPLPPMPPCFITVCKPDFSISTPELFKKLDSVHLKGHPDTAGLIAALEKGSLPELCRRMYNVFEDVGDRRMRTVSQIKGQLLDHGALGAVMTGTGSAVFGVFQERGRAETACAALQKEYGFCCVTDAVGRLL